MADSALMKGVTTAIDAARDKSRGLIAVHEAADVAALKAKDDALAAVQAAFDAYKLTHPDAPPPPPPPPPPPTGAAVDEQFNGWAGTASPDGVWRIAGTWQGTGNNTLQPANVAFANGQMALTVPAGSPLRGGELQSLPSYGYGYYVARIKTSNVKNGGVVSFFWIESPSYGPHEWDIEFTLSDSWAGTTSPGRVSFTTHPLDNTQWVNLAFNPSQAFHDYGFLWTPGKIQFTVDGVVVRTVTDPVLNTSAVGYIMMNAWSGIANFGGGPPTVPATSFYDRVRFYPGATSIPGATPTGFPDASSAGVPAGVTLTPYSGAQVIQVAGTIIDGKDITQALVVRADNVTIRNSRIRYNDFFGISHETGANLRVENNDIIGPGKSGDSPAAISCDVGGATFIGNDISGAEHGIAFGPGAALATGNYIHGDGSNKADPHIGGFSLKGGQKGVVIRGNTVELSDQATSDVFIQANVAAIDDVTVDHNLLIGKPGFVCYAEDRLGFPCTNVQFTNNVMAKGGFATVSDPAYFSINNPVVVKSGNTDYLTGAPI